MRLAALFADHAVLQRDLPIPVWGWARPRARVRVVLGDAQAQGLAGGDGRFLLRLPPQPAGGPHHLEATDLDSGVCVAASDVWIGEVWVASGQSNMEWTLAATGPVGEAEILQADDPGLRMFTVPKTACLGRTPDVAGSWRPGGRETIGAFSAVAYHFAKRLRQELNLVVGILHSSWGGTAAEAWTGREWLVDNPHTAAIVARYEAEVHAPEFWNRSAGFCHAYPADPGNLGEAAGWARPGTAHPDWTAVALPNYWQSLGHPYSGVLWFRKAVDLPAAWAGKTLALNLGAVDKQDTTYVNGVQVGATGQGFDESHYNEPRRYLVPGPLVTSGQITIAVRAYSFVYGGGLTGPAEAMTLAPADGSGEAIPLAGQWFCRIEHNLGVTVPPSPPPGPDNPNTPYILHDSMIAPLKPYAIRGAIWYQGESNAGRANEYQRLLTDLIRCWRREWGQGDFPFLIVQLANFLAPTEHQPESNWARLREAQLGVLSEPATGMAVAIDIGDAGDIHPRNKHDVGQRLAVWALATTYQKPVVPSGPIYRSMTVEGSGIRLRFEHAAGGLASASGPLRTFVVAGADRRFKTAMAVIDGAAVLVSSPEVPAPVAVRYAWADNPDGCNLRNLAGLPASPFRTDCWA